MNSFFDTPEKITLLDRSAREWIGTPFAPHASLKHVGADCVGLVAGIYLANGVLKKFTPGNYTLDEGQHAKSSKVAAWFAGHPEFVQITSSTWLAVHALPGDTLVFNLARVGHHVGLVLEQGDIIHSMFRRWAIISNLRESFYSSTVVEIWRPVTQAEPLTLKP